MARTGDVVAEFVPDFPLQLWCHDNERASRDTPALAAALVKMGEGMTCSPTKRVHRLDFDGDVWRKAVETAGLPKGTRFHDLRHTYASLLIEAGESVTVVSKRLGHSSAVETLGTYAHMWPDSDGRTVDVLNAAWARHVSPDVSQDNAGLAFLQVKR